MNRFTSRGKVSDFKDNLKDFCSSKNASMKLRVFKVFLFQGLGVMYMERNGHRPRPDHNTQDIWFWRAFSNRLGHADRTLF